MPALPDALPVKNTTTEAVPAFGLMRVTGVTADGVLEVAKPDADGQVVLTNGPTVIPPSTFVAASGALVASGQGTFAPRTPIAYDPADGTPAAGETWGAGAGSWVAKKDKPGFLVFGGAGAGVVNAVRWSAEGTVSAWKQPVRCATTANGTLATAFAAGQTVDGVVLATGDRVLLKSQTTGGQNGIYTVNASGAPTRAADCDAGAEFVGATAWVSEGTTNADTIWACTTNAPITVGTTATTWVKVYPSTPTSSWKDAVRAATTTAGTLSSSFASGQTVDGVILATGDRVLIKDQSSGAENGVYTVNASGAPTRAADAATGADLVGAVAYVCEGTANADTGWACTTDAPITIGSTATVWAKMFPGTGSAWKEPVRVRSTANVTVSNPGTSTFDGVSATSGDRVLLMNQSTPTQNGIYVFNGSSSAMTRAADADTGAELLGATVFVSEGTQFADTVFTCTNNAPILIGTTNLVFENVPNKLFGTKTFRSATPGATAAARITPATGGVDFLLIRDTAGSLPTTPGIGFFTNTTGGPVYIQVAHDPTYNAFSSLAPAGYVYYALADPFGSGVPQATWSFGDTIYCGGIGCLTLTINENYGIYVSDGAGGGSYGIGFGGGTTRTVKDGAGVNQTVTIKNGIITGWTT